MNLEAGYGRQRATIDRRRIGRAVSCGEGRGRAQPLPDDLASGEGAFHARGRGDRGADAALDEQACAAYAEEGADALGDRRRRNPGARPLLSEADLEALQERLKEPPDDGGVWTGPKVARWIAARLGLVHVHEPRGWEPLKKIGWSIQVPRPKNPKAAPPEAQEALKKARRDPRRGAEKHVPLPVELWATDEHRLGLKPVPRRVWAPGPAPIGARPVGAPA